MDQWYEDIRRLAQNGYTRALAAQIQLTKQRIADGSLRLDENQAFMLLDTLTVAGLSDDAAEVAESLRRIGRDWPFLDRTYAQALIERGQYAAAQRLLVHLLSQNGLAPFEVAACYGQLGRIRKSLAKTHEVHRQDGGMGGERKASMAHYRRALQFAEAPGHPETEDERRAGRHLYRAWRWGATNLLTLMVETDASAGEVNEAARSILARIEDRQRLKGDIDYFDDSARGAAYLALGRFDLALAEYRNMIDRPDVSLGQIERVLRDFTENRSRLVQENTEVADIKHLLEAARLRRLRGTIVVSKDDRHRLISQHQRLREGDEQRLTRHAYAVRWLADGLRTAGAIARVHREGRVGGGSGFLVAGECLGLADKRAVLVTCSHVLSARGSDDRIAGTDAVVSFEWPTDQQGQPSHYKVKEILFESSDTMPGGLDATIAELEGDVSKLDVLPTESGDNIRRAADQVDIAGGYTIGHPLGRELSLTLGAATFTERYTSYLSLLEPQFLRYTTETMGGNSGGPIFDLNWHAVAVHQTGLEDGKTKAGRGLELAALFRIVRSRLGR